MAVPILTADQTEVMLSPVSGSEADLVFTFSDPDAQIVNVGATVQDLEGNRTSMTVPVRVEDLTFVDDGSDGPAVTTRIVAVTPSTATVRITKT